MEWFGSTYSGLADPIKDMMRQDYKEPLMADLSMEEKLTKFETNTIAIDCYLPRVDGYAYGSQDLWQRMRLKGLPKRVGPIDMYKYPGLRSMDYGWFLSDEELKNENWYLNKKNFTNLKTDITNSWRFT